MVVKTIGEPRDEGLLVHQQKLEGMCAVDGCCIASTLGVHQITATHISESAVIIVSLMGKDTDLVALPSIVVILI
jgi:hypothetical protein